MKEIKTCPNCNKRIFDVFDNAKGVIEIKCPKCKKIVNIKLEIVNAS